MRLDSRQVVILIVINLVISFAVPGIAWEDHVGGLIAGGLLTVAFAYAPRRNRTLIQVGATVVMVAIMVIAVVVRDQPASRSSVLGLGRVDGLLTTALAGMPA